MNQIKQLLIAVLDKMNLWEQNAKSIDELPTSSSVVPTAKIHVSEGGTSKALELQKLIDAALGFSINQLTSIGEITVDGNDVTTPPATWKIANVSYSTSTDTITNHAFSATGTTRIDILVANASNQILKVSGSDTSGIAIRPNIPLNTILVTEINVSEDSLTAVPFPLSTNQIEAIQGANTPSATNPFATMLDIISGAIITGLIAEGTNITITGSGTTADPYVISSSGGGTSTPTLQEVILQGNTITDNSIELTDTTGDYQSTLDMSGVSCTTADGNSILSSVMLSLVKRVAGIATNRIYIFGDLIRYTETGVEFTNLKFNTPTGNGIYQFRDLVNETEQVAVVSEIPTTPTEVGALAIDGSNANQDVDLGEVYGLKANNVKIQTAGASKSIKILGSNLTNERTAEWQDKDYIGIEDISNKGVANGYAPLNMSLQVPSEFLPSYVDDIIDGYLSGGVFYEESSHTTPITGEVGKIYVDLTTGQSSKQYRWSGSIYIQITNGLIASTNDIPEGSNLYFTTARVLATLLTGISVATGGAIVSTDSVLVAFGKLQKQLNDIPATITSALATFKTAEFLDATSSIQGQLDGKEAKHSFISQLDPYTGTSSTALQKLSNQGTSGNGSKIVDANSRYRVEIEFAVSGLSSTTNSVQFGLLGSAVIAKIFGESFASKSATLISSNTPSHTAINIATISAALMTTGIQAFARAKMSFTFTTGTGGSLIPSFATNVSTTPVVEFFHFELTKLGTDTTTTTSDIV